MTSRSNRALARGDHSIGGITWHSVPTHDTGKTYLHKGKAFRMTPLAALRGDHDWAIVVSANRYGSIHADEDDVIQSGRGFLAKYIADYDEDRSSPPSWLLKLGKWAVWRINAKSTAVHNIFFKGKSGENEIITMCSLDGMRADLEEKGYSGSTVVEWRVGLIDKRTPEDAVGTSELYQAVDEAISRLDPDAQFVVRSRLPAMISEGEHAMRGSPSSFRAIASKMGVTGARAQQIYSGAMSRVRAEVGARLGLVDEGRLNKLRRPVKFLAAIKAVHCVYPETITVTELAATLGIKRNSVVGAIGTLRALGLRSDGVRHNRSGGQPYTYRTQEVMRLAGKLEAHYEEE